MKKPIIGIVGRINGNDKNSIFVNDEYRYAIVQAGGIPILLLPNYSSHIKYITPFYDNVSNSQIDSILKLVDLCDGILFPGGSEWYGFDQKIYQYAYEKNIPILGICLGMQMIGSSSYFDKSVSDATYPLSNSFVHMKENSYVHSILLQPSKLKSLLQQDNILVNSRHTCAISNHDNFSVAAVADDGTIEAIEIPEKKFILGVQWHPETLYDFDFNSQIIFKSFILSCLK